MPELEHEFDDELKSKTEIKQEMHKMQDFALSIVKMSKHQRSKLPLSEEVQEALVLADKIQGKHEALRRHVRFMAKVFVEKGIEDIVQAIEVMQNKHQQIDLKNQRLEQLAVSLIEQGNNEIEALLSEQPTMERQKLRQLVRQAAKEHKVQKPAKYHQELIKYIKTHQAD